MALLGKFGFALHSHIPYVLSHGVWPHGTDWLNEAAAETYLPLLKIIDELEEEGIKASFTVGITPVLAEMLAHPHFLEQFEGYLEQKRQAAE